MANNLLCLLLFAGCYILLWCGLAVNCNITDLWYTFLPVIKTEENDSVPIVGDDYEKGLSSDSANTGDYQNWSFSDPSTMENDLIAEGQTLNLSKECLETAQRMNLLNKSDNDCGGVLVGREKTFWSSSIQEDCKWLVCNDYRRHFRFVALAMHANRECDKYYFDVCDGCQLSKYGSHLEKGTKLKLCGAKRLSELVSSNQIIILEYRLPLFEIKRWPLAAYQLLKHVPDCVLTSNAENGIIVSPEYPDVYPEWMPCEWKINAPVAHKNILTTIDFHMPGKSLCPEDQTFLQIWDGSDEEYPLITRYSGENPPPLTFISNSNKVIISSPCNETLRVSSGVISSPSFRNINNSGLHCNWKIIVNPGNIIRLVFLEFWATNVFTYPDEDYVEIADIDGNDISKLKYCRSRNPPGAIYTAGNEVVITVVSSPGGYKGKALRLRFNAVCTRSVSGGKGTIESINYPHILPLNLNCRWTIDAGKKGSVFINLTHVHIGYTGFGSLRIFEPERVAGWGDVGCRIERTNQTAPAVCLSRGNIVTVELKTSSQMEYRGTGFRLEWEIQGCNKRIRGRHGTIQSSGYPYRYPTSEVCEWKIITDYESRVELTIHDWEIEKSIDCKFDGLKVFTGLPHLSQPILQLCGTSQYPLILTSHLNAMYIQLYSDDSLSFRGFNASFKQIKASNSAITCGEDHFAPTGYIYSPNFPESYNSFEHCRWTITVHHNYLVALKILELEIEEGPTNCVYDNLTVNYEVTTEPPNKVFCGRHILANVVSSNNVMTLDFQTDLAEVAKGFKSMFFQACGARLNRDSGIIQSPDFLSMMNGAGNCSWTIIPSTSESRVVLLFTDYYWSVTDSNCVQHYIEVFDGTGKNTSLYKGCCRHVPPVILSSGNVLTLSTTNAEELDFKAFYFTVTEGCINVLRATNSSTMAAKAEYATREESKRACQQTLHATSEYQYTVNVQFQLYQPKLHRHLCMSSFMEVHEQNFSDPPSHILCRQVIPNTGDAANYYWSVYIILDEANDSAGAGNQEKNTDSNLTNSNVQGNLSLSGADAKTGKIVLLLMLPLFSALG